MNERRPGFFPKIRKGEAVPDVPEDKELTRVNGELVVVTAKLPNEGYYGNSPYTRRQLCEIYRIKQTMLEKTEG